MAFTPWKTWSVGETLTAANFNQQIRDNGLTDPPHLIARKTSDQSVTSSTVLVDDAALKLTVAANEIWQVQIGMLWTAGAGNMDVGFTFPTSGSMSFSGDAVSVAGSFVKKIWYSTTSPTSRLDFLAQSGPANFHLISGVYTNGANAGTVTLQFSQNSSSGTATTMKANSTIWAVKLA